MTRNILTLLVVLGLALPASANYNSRYGETEWGKLPTSGQVSKNIWIGSWWPYKYNGIAWRQNGEGDMSQKCSSWSPCKPDAYLGQEPAVQLSPAEKYDLYVGRADKIEREPMVTFLKNIQEKESEVSQKIERRRELIRLLNKLIDEKSGEEGFNWQETDDGKEYLEVTQAIEESEKLLDDNKPEIDTATEWEIWNHGTAQFGVGSWWGHCNAWSAAAIMEPEPRFAHTTGDVEFTPGDVKAYMTELYMEIQSTFWGTRNEYHKDEASRNEVSYKDVTPATFHIAFADIVGNKDEAFVIDRYTGDQVWNQPVKAFRSSFEVLNGGEPVDREIVVTKYPYSGPAKEVSLGTQTVWEVSVTTTFWWVTDGRPPEELTVQNVRAADLSDSEFASSYKVEELYDGQIELRTLNYTLWLDKDPNDAGAEIVGDGEWNHGATSGYEHLHPDFIWKPTANLNNSRDYENPFLDYAKVEAEILPGTLSPAEDPTVEPTGGFSAMGPFDIPDKEFKTGLSVPVEVSGAPTAIAELEAHVVITHSYIGDLKISLTAPDGHRANLKKVGTGGSDDDIDRTYTVKKFIGQDANGTWTLRVWDKWESDVGTVDSFELNFK